MKNIWLWPRFRSWVNARRAFPIPAADGPGNVGGRTPPAAPYQRPARTIPLAEAMHKYLPPGAAPRFRRLVEVYDRGEIEFPHLKGVTTAQWGIESAWGNSRLARVGANFAGMKWREGDRKYGGYPGNRTQDGYESGFRYTFFENEAGFIAAFWKRLDEVGAYRGWRNHTATPYDWLAFVGPTWVGYEPKKYVRNVWDSYNRRVKPLEL